MSSKEFDLISRADVLKLMKDNWHTHNGDWAMQESMDDIRALPSVTPQEPRKGHWIVQPSNKEQGERDFIWWKCSECGQVIFSETEKDRKEFHAFCGRCGANMESEDKE